MSLSDRMNFNGINNILVTPFTETEMIDFDSICNMIDKIVSKGVNAITILGVAGEAHKLSVQERNEVTVKAIETVAGRCPVVVGTSGNSIEEVISASQRAENNGAKAVMVAPPKGLQFGSELIRHYKGLANSISIPIVLQDYAEVTGVDLSPENMSELLKAVPQIAAIKLETPPTPLRIGETRKLVDNDIAIVGGNGGILFFDELTNGANGTMNGFSYTEALVEIWNHWNNGENNKAKESYSWILPLLNFEFHPKIGLAIRKEILRRRGWIKTAILRGDSSCLSPEILSELTNVLEHFQKIYSHKINS